jgi:Rrf2 family iron-sulfur cluster assembly transcriptional regulator
MLDVGRSGQTESPVSLATVAAQAGLSRGYLEQLALALRNAQLLRGQCGKGGGYRLARPTDRISVREVIEAVIGPINVVECVGSPEVCLSSEHCECRPVYALINQRITEALDGFTLADLLETPLLPDQLRVRDDSRSGTSAIAAERFELRPAQPKRKHRASVFRPTARHGGCPGGRVDG